jgi:DNA-binding CsgD family transcriptional regulator
MKPMTPQNALSEREKQVADLLLQGKSNKEIALALGISVRTVEFHLTHIFEKVGASSRAETIVKLSTRQPGSRLLGETPDGTNQADLRETPVDFSAPSPQNERKPFTDTWRRSMKTIAYTAFGLLAVLLIIILALPPAAKPLTDAQTPEIPSITPSQAPTASLLAQPTLTSSLPVSQRDQIMAEVHRLVAEYDAVVKDELKGGEVDIHTDPKTGKELILFTGESKDKIELLYGQILDRLSALNRQYLALFIADVEPTPFPTLPSGADTEAAYQALVSQYSAWFEGILLDGPTIEMYDPNQGAYQKLVAGDTYAKSKVMEKAMNALHDAPIIAGIDQPAQIAVIQAALAQPDLHLAFQKVETMANAPSIHVAIYLDEAGTRYSVTNDTGRLAAIQPAETAPIDVPAAEVKTIEMLRPVAEKFALAHSPRYAQMKNDLRFEEGGKGDIYFYTWHIKNKDWSGTDWAMMPPFLQIGVSADGTIRTYINTLDLY